MTTAQYYASVQCKSFQAFMAQYTGYRRHWGPLYAFFADIHDVISYNISLNPWDGVYLLRYEGHYASLPLPKWACDVLIAINEDEEAL